MRWVARTTAALFIGALANVLVAWSCALWSPVHQTVFEWRAPTEWPVYVPNHEAKNVPAYRFAQGPACEFRGTGLVKGYGTVIAVEPKKEDLAAGRPAEDVYDECSRDVCYSAAGWPLWAFEGVVYARGDGDVGEPGRGALTAPDWLHATNRSFQPCFGLGYCHLPTAVRPVGAAVNTAVFTAGALIALLAPRKIRGMWRIRAGRCIKCNYDRKGLSPGACCPECGS
jgi:hypothetical protein